MKFGPLLRNSVAPILLTTTLLSAQAFVPSTIHLHRSTTTRLFSSASSTLPPLLDSNGSPLSTQAAAEQIQGKQVAYYFAAGWCPMCTSFEPSLSKFQQENQDKIEIVYVASDRSEKDALQRAKAMNFLSVPFGEEADKLKKEYNIWAGVESVKFGMGRRSGVPALVVLNGETGKELAFLPAESQGPKALKSWPLTDSKGVF